MTLEISMDEAPTASANAGHRDSAPSGGAGPASSTEAARAE